MFLLGLLMLFLVTMIQYLVARGNLFWKKNFQKKEKGWNGCKKNLPEYCQQRGYSSVVEHLTADQEVPGSNPGAPFPGFPFFTAAG